MSCDGEDDEDAPPPGWKPSAETIAAQKQADAIFAMKQESQEDQEFFDCQFTAEQPLSVGRIRKTAFPDPKVQEVIDFLLKEIAYARQSAIGYASICIAEGLCPEEECDDIEGWQEEEKDAEWFGAFQKK